MLGLGLVALAAGGAGYLALQHLRPTPSVRGRTAVIVGASAGIGRCLALEYARGGAELLICARRAAELERVGAECEAAGAQAVHCVVGDITQRATQLALRDRAADVWGRVDYLVLNAGAISVQEVVDLWGIRAADGLRAADGSAAEHADRALRQIMDVNVHAPAALAGLFLPLVAACRGVVVVVSSMAGLVAAPTRSLYSASKHAVTGYFSALRMEVGGLGVAVTIAYPGSVATDLREAAVDARSPGAAVAGSASRMSPAVCACQIVRAAALRQPSLITPWPYAVAAALHAVAPGLVERMAKRKYGLA
ncbi:hypothetical protein LPJ61_003040 [Coemansia biformis]|uniref:NAD(P)-binding protein n=1 Tax=Coemansia biformis TaxID=1286918 RepID=A0A9W7Y7A1_9FUNG|nr:hypothetical protein LPJ61_003040 [Coemansia biformis]